MTDSFAPDEAKRLTRLVQEHQRMLLRLCYVQLRDEEQARDAVQETFLKAFRALEGFRAEASEKTWLIRIALNTCRSMQRSGWWRFHDRRVTPEEIPVGEEAVCDEDIDLMCAVMQLPGRLREVIVLRYWQNMTVDEIAQTLGIAQSSASERLKRAQEKLRGMLEGRETDEGTR